MTQTMPTTDGSGYQVTASTWAGWGYAYLVSVVKTNGTILGLIGGQGSPAKSQDSNGNQITSSFSNGSTQIHDTLDSNANALTITPGSPMTLSFPNPQGGQSTYTVTYSPKTVQTAFGCLGISEYGPISGVNLVTSITLPDGTGYAFNYEQTPGNPANVTGRLISVTLPTGGTITYQYQGGSNGITCADGSTATLKRRTPDSAPDVWWTYAHTEPAAPNPWLTTITDPQGNVTSLKFQGTQGGGLVSNALYEVERVVKQGASTTLVTVNTCYNGTLTGCTTAAIAQPISIVSATTLLPGSANLRSQVARFYDGYGLPTQVNELDYGNGLPGTLIRATIVDYNRSLGNGIVDHPASVTVHNSSGQTVAQMTYLYDQGTLQSTSNTPQLVSISGSRGNLTTVATQTTGSTSLTKYFTYYDTGNVHTATDVNGTVTIYGYDSGTEVASCGNSFLTSTSVASLSTSMSWNCDGGVPAWSKDANGQKTVSVRATPPLTAAVARLTAARPPTPPA